MAHGVLVQREFRNELGNWVALSVRTQHPQPGMAELHMRGPTSQASWQLTVMELESLLGAAASALAGCGALHPTPAPAVPL